MIKHFLLSAAVIAGASTMMYGDSMDSNLKLIWKSTDCASLSADARQGVGHNGKVYIQNKATSKTEVWGELGKEKEIASGGGTNINIDDAGNILVRTGTFNTNLNGTGAGVMIIPADGSATKTFDLTGVPNGRCDYFGHVSGNVLGKDNSFMYIALNWGSTIWEGMISEAEMVSSNNNTAPTFNADIKSGAAITTTAIVNAWNFMPNDIAFLSPHVTATSQYGTNKCGNSIYHLVFDEENENWINDGFYRTPRHNGCSGLDIFQLGGETYIVYPSGNGCIDGFTISKINYTTYPQTPASDDADEALRVATKYADTDDTGNVKYTTNTCYGCQVNAEVNETEGYADIYQYVHGAYAAQYRFTPDKTGVTDMAVEENDAKVVGAEGYIYIKSNEKVQVYTPAGVLVANTNKNVNVQPGLYIVKTGKTAQKVIVK